MKKKIKGIKKIMGLSLAGLAGGILFGISAIITPSVAENKNLSEKNIKLAQLKEEFQSGFVQDIQEFRKVPEANMFVDKNIKFKPGPLPQNKVLIERGDSSELESEDEDDDDDEGLIGVSSRVRMDPTNPVFLSGSGRMAGTGDTRVSLASAAARIGAGQHPKALEVAGLSVDEFGLVNWADAIRKGKIAPIAGLTARKRAAENYEEYIIVFQAMSDYMADVVFPHDIHSYWLDCSNCHRKIFIDKAGANPVTMKKVVAGQYCGRCHGKVAFPLESCTRCHVKPKGGGAIVKYPLYDAPQEIFPGGKK